MNYQTRAPMLTGTRVTRPVTARRYWKRMRQMCLTTEALLIFLNLIGPDIVTSEPGRFIVHAEQGDATWTREGERWCTAAPQIDKAAER